MLPPLKKWPRKQPYQQVRPDKEAVHCHTFEKMAAQTALSAGGVCRSAALPCLPFARHPPASGRCLPLRIPPVPAVCAASPRQGEASAAPHPPVPAVCAASPRQREGSAAPPPPVPAVCAASPRQREVSAAPHPPVPAVCAASPRQREVYGVGTCAERMFPHHTPLRRAPQARARERGRNQAPP